MSPLLCGDNTQEIIHLYCKGLFICFHLVQAAEANLEQGILTERQCTQLVEQHEAAQDWLREQVKGLGASPEDRKGLHGAVNTLKVRYTETNTLKVRYINTNSLKVRYTNTNTLKVRYINTNSLKVRYINTSVQHIYFF